MVLVLVLVLVCVPNDSMVLRKVMSMLSVRSPSRTRANTLDEPPPGLHEYVTRPNPNSGGIGSACEMPNPI